MTNKKKPSYEKATKKQLQCWCEKNRLSKEKYKSKCASIKKSLKIERDEIAKMREAQGVLMSVNASMEKISAGIIKELEKTREKKGLLTIALIAAILFFLAALFIR